MMSNKMVLKANPKYTIKKEVINFIEKNLPARFNDAKPVLWKQLLTGFYLLRYQLPPF